MILTNEEIKAAVGFTTDQMVAYRKVEAAIIKKIGEPVAWMQVSVEEGVDTCVPRKRKPSSYNKDWWQFCPLYKLPEAIK